MVAGLPSNDGTGTCVSTSLWGGNNDEISGLRSKRLYPNSDMKYQFRTKVLTMLEQKNKYHEDFRQYSPAEKASQAKKSTVLRLVEQRTQSSSRPSSSKSRQQLTSPIFFCSDLVQPSSQTTPVWSCKSHALVTQESRMKTLRSTLPSNSSDDNDVGRYRFDALKLVDFTYIPSAQTRHEVDLAVEFPFHLNIDRALVKQIRFDGNSRSKEMGNAQVSYFTQSENKQKFVETNEGSRKSRSEEEGNRGRQLMSTDQGSLFISRHQHLRGRSMTRIARSRSYSSASTTSSNRRKDRFLSSSPISKIPKFQEINLFRTPTKLDRRKHQRVKSKSRSARSLDQSYSRALKTSPRVSLRARTSLIPPPSFKYRSPSSVPSSSGRKVPTIPKPFNLSRGRTLSRSTPSSPSVKSCPPSSNRYSDRKLPTVPQPFNLSVRTPHRQSIRTTEDQLPWSVSPKSFKARPLPKFYSPTLSRSDSPVHRTKDKHENLNSCPILQSLEHSFENLNETAKEGEKSFNSKMDAVNQNLSIIHDELRSRLNELVQIASDRPPLTHSRKESNSEKVGAKMDEITNNMGILQNGISGVKALLEAQGKQRKMEMMILCSDCGSFVYYNGFGHKKYSCDLVKIVLQWFALGHGCNIRADYTTEKRSNNACEGGRRDFVTKLLAQIKDIIGHKPRLVKKEDGSHDIFFS